MNALRIGDVVLRRELWQTLRGWRRYSAGAGRRVLIGAASSRQSRSSVVRTVTFQRDLRHMFLPRLEPDDYLDLQQRFSGGFSR